MFGKSGENDHNVMKHARSVYHKENKGKSFAQDDAVGHLENHSKWDALEPVFLVEPVDLTGGELVPKGGHEGLFGKNPRPRPLGKANPAKKANSRPRRASREVTRQTHSGIRCQPNFVKNGKPPSRLTREHKRMILESVEHGPLIWPTIEENGVTKTKKYDNLSAAEKIQADCDMKAANIILQGLAVLVFSPGDDPIAYLNKAMAFLTAVVSLRGNNASRQEKVSDGQAVQTIIPNNVAFQTKDLDTYDSDCNDVSNVKAVLMANIFDYGSDVILEVSSKKAKIVESKNANHSEPNNAWGSYATDIPSSSLVMTARFGNDHISRILGYDQLGNVTISRVYYIEGLGHNLFFVGEFCDADLEVAFRKNTCFIRNLEGVELLSGSRDTNLYTISLDDVLKTSLICLLSKASKTKSWLWHHRLSHLNFGTLYNTLCFRVIVRRQ
nr:retrovirus-related Pol polyprotein from transposon TNT 1-94 [Tanacetum cinerariifolium]